jgi:uncharacterized membrane protein YeiH
MPAYASGLCMLLYPAVFQLLGLYYGAAAAAALYATYYSYMRQPLILQYDSRTSMGWSWGLVLAISSVHLIFVARHVSVFSTLVLLVLDALALYWFADLCSNPTVSLKPTDFDRFVMLLHDMCSRF